MITLSANACFSVNCFLEPSLLSGHPKSPHWVRERSPPGRSCLLPEGYSPKGRLAWCLNKVLSVAYKVLPNLPLHSHPLHLMHQSHLTTIPFYASSLFMCWKFGLFGMPSSSFSPNKVQLKTFLYPSSPLQPLGGVFTCTDGLDEFQAFFSKYRCVAVEL